MRPRLFGPRKFRRMKNHPVGTVGRFNEAAAVWAAEVRGLRHRPGKHSSCFNEAAAVWAAEELVHAQRRSVLRLASMRPRLFGPRKGASATSSGSRAQCFNEAAAVWAAEVTLRDIRSMTKALPLQ